MQTAVRGVPLIHCLFSPGFLFLARASQNSNSLCHCALPGSQTWPHVSEVADGHRHFCTKTSGQPNLYHHPLAAIRNWLHVIESKEGDGITLLSIARLLCSTHCAREAESLLRGRRFMTPMAPITMEMVQRACNEAAGRLDPRSVYFQHWTGPLNDYVSGVPYLHT